MRWSKVGPGGGGGADDDDDDEEDSDHSAQGRVGRRKPSRNDRGPERPRRPQGRLLRYHDRLAPEAHGKPALQTDLGDVLDHNVHVGPLATRQSHDLLLRDRVAGPADSGFAKGTLKPGPLHAMRVDPRASGRALAQADVDAILRGPPRHHDGDHDLHLHQKWVDLQH